MTDSGPVVSGLAEPEGLEPAPGSLALQLPGPAATRAQWEQAAAQVLRKAGRLADDEPDAEAWARLGRRTLDGIAVSPLGTPSLVSETGTTARPAEPGGRDVRVELYGGDPRVLNAEALAD